MLAFALISTVLIIVLFFLLVQNSRAMRAEDSDYIALNTYRSRFGDMSSEKAFQIADNAYHARQTIKTKNEAYTKLIRKEDEYNDYGYLLKKSGK